MNDIMNSSKQTISLYIALISLIATPLFFFISYLNEPSYNPFLQTISKLGVTDSGQYYFIAGTIIGGVSFIIFYYFSFLELAQTDSLIYRARIFGIISGIGLIGVGVIQDKPELFFSIFHPLSADIFFLFNILFIIYFRFYIKKINLVEKYRFLYNSAFVPVVVLILYVFLSLIAQEITIGSIIFKIPIIWQKITVLSLIVWYLILFYYVDKKNLSKFLTVQK